LSPPKPATHLDRIVVVIKINVPWSPSIISHKVFVAFWPLVLRIAGQHTLYAHAYALDILHGTPALGAEEVEADYAVGVNVWVHRDRTVDDIDESHFWRLCSDRLVQNSRNSRTDRSRGDTDGIRGTEFELQSVGLVHV